MRIPKRTSLSVSPGALVVFGRARGERPFMVNKVNVTAVYGLKSAWSG